jgi:lipopolysaccharide export system protein LptA
MRLNDVCRGEEGGTRLKRGESLGLRAWLAVLVIASCCVLVPYTAWSQNTAETTAPETDTSTATASAENTADAPADPGAVDTAAEEIAVPGEVEEAGEPATSGPALVVPNTAEAAVEAAEQTEPGSVDVAPGPQVEQDVTPALVPAEQPTEQPAESPNAAESRPAGTGAANLAEEQPASGVDKPGVAEPPVPDLELPSPGQLAGAAEDYVKPELSIAVPQIEEPPLPQLEDRFFQPERGYLGSRPLPPVDETETEEERAARSIEESLAMLNLAAEQRPAEGIRIPLPSGLMTFKASDAFQYDRRNKILTFTGDVEIVLNDIAIWGDMVEVDDGAATAYAQGYVGVQQGDDIVYCDEAYINYDTGTLELFWVEGNTSGKYLYEPMYFEADRIYGTFDHMIMEGAVITTCAPFCGAHPDYEIKADKVHYKRGKSIVMHSCYLFMRDRKVGWLPVLAMPLPKDQGYEQEESDIQQTYGYKRNEGWYAKFAYTYSARWVEGIRKPLRGVVKMELKQKRGAGLGIRQDYYIPHLGVGTIRAYYQEDWPEAIAIDLFGRSAADAGEEFDLEYGQDLNFSRELTGTIDFKRVNSFIPSASQSGGSRTNYWKGDFKLNFRRNGTTAGLLASENLNTRGGYIKTDGTEEPRSEDTTASASFTFDRKLTKELQFKLAQTYTSNKGGNYPNLPADQEGTFTASLDFRGAQEGKLEGYQARLSYRESAIDYDGDARTTERHKMVNDQLPSFQLRLPNDLFGEGAFFNTFVVDVDKLVTGRRSSPQEAERMHIEVSGRESTQFSNAARLSYSTGFHQYWYDDGNAQYVISPRLDFTYNPQTWWSFKTGWNLKYQQGVANPPVSSDRQYYSQGSSYSFNFSNNRSWRWQLGSGFDFKTWNHRPITSSFNWDASRTFGLTHTTTYNLANKNWSQSKIKASWRSPFITPNGYYNWLLSMSFDFQTDYWGKFRGTRLNTHYFHRFRNGWSGEVVGQYSATGDIEPTLSTDFLKDFVRKIVVRKVNCCTTWEATWRTQINEVQLYIYLNALPQYPGTYIGSHTDEDEFEQQFLFPVDKLRGDILTEVLGADVIPALR